MLVSLSDLHLNDWQNFNLLAHERVLVLELGVGGGVRGHERAQLVHGLLEALADLDPALSFLADLSVKKDLLFNWSVGQTKERLSDCKSNVKMR
jgi:hypothetical protein